jgi:hypothetical protein
VGIEGGGRSIFIDEDVSAMGAFPGPHLKEGDPLRELLPAIAAVESEQSKSVDQAKT